MWSLSRRRIGRPRRLVKRPRPARDVFFADPAAVEADYRRFQRRAVDAIAVGVEEVHAWHVHGDPHLPAGRPVPR